jgi:hypothetical protein
MARVGPTHVPTNNRCGQVCNRQHAQCCKETVVAFVELILNKQELLIFCRPSRVRIAGVAIWEADKMAWVLGIAYVPNVR